MHAGEGASVGHVEVAHLGHILPDGRVLLEDASFRIGEGTTAALVGPNGAGKTTLIRLIAGDISAQSGTIAVSGGLGVMRQFIGGIRGAGAAGSGEVPASASPAGAVPASPAGAASVSLADPAAVRADSGRVTGGP